MNLVVGANVKQMLYAKNKLRQNTENHIFFSGHFGYSSRVGGQLGKNKRNELRASVEKILYTKKPAEIQEIKLFSAVIFNIVAMLAATFEKKFM